MRCAIAPPMSPSHVKYSPHTHVTQPHTESAAVTVGTSESKTKKSMRGNTGEEADASGLMIAPPVHCLGLKPWLSNSQM